MNAIKSFMKLSILAATLLLAPCVHADPVTIASGTIQYSRSTVMTFTLNGSGFNSTGFTAPLNASVSLLSNGFIAAGGTGSTGGSLDTQDGDLFASSPITVGGTLFSPANTLLQLNFNSTSFVAPLQTASGFVVTAPFTLTSGLIEGYPGALGEGVALFSSPLSGSGTTTLFFLRTGSGQYQLQAQTFVFGQTVSGVSVQAVPEPASLLLFSASLVGLLKIRRKRRS